MVAIIEGYPIVATIEGYPIIGYPSMVATIG